MNVAIADEHHVVRSGPYLWVRHPSYSGDLLMLLGFCVSLGNLASFLVMIVPSVGVTLWRIRIEEAARQQGRGEPYAAHMRSARRSIPKIY